MRFWIVFFFSFGLTWLLVIKCSTGHKMEIVLEKRLVRRLSHEL